MSTGSDADILPDGWGVACAPQHHNGGLIRTWQLVVPSDTPGARQGLSIPQPHMTLNT